MEVVHIAQENRSDMVWSRGRNAKLKYIKVMKSPTIVVEDQENDY